MGAAAAWAAAGTASAPRVAVARATSAARARASGRWGMADLHRGVVVEPENRARGQGLLLGGNAIETCR
ncbi:hypothetical protein GCM10009541_50700 [Micromonospora gifhornensis]|uniref:Uncharacterized protein n=1 Tax=Micromonospora gifhornensis TaxID=84594 RepID=A0ABQ4I780_9ACTN|nr:hypothetical protein Vgi01_04380 [Micromonospora gifhornensis]